MMSIRSPTALRIFSNGSSADFRSAQEMSLPARLLRGRVERPDLHAGDALLEQVVSASSSARFRKASRSS